MVRCDRCGKEEPATKMATGAGFLLPECWEGSFPHEAVCPGCQFAEWHPHCTSVATRDGERVDLEPLGRGEPVTIQLDGVPVRFNSVSEFAPGTLVWCDYVDLSVSYIDDEPTDWRCARCGGTTFEGVHADYQESGPSGATFTIETEEVDDDEA
jgi:hypothetical protein